MSSGGPIETLPLFPELSRRFVALLEDLAPEDWQKLVSEKWRARDVVAHLVDSSLRRLSAQRDGHVSDIAVSDGDYASLLAYLNRLSPRVLTDLVRWSDRELFAHLSSLDPVGPAIWPVAWAGETISQNWFDIAREYTEKWHHAQQVFDATARPSTIADRALLHPCLDTLMRGLPHGLRAHTAPASAVVRVHVTGAAGGDWCVLHCKDEWRLVDSDPGITTTTVSMPQDAAWKVLMKRISAAEARARFTTIQIIGDQRLGDAVLETVCVMA